MKKHAIVKPLVTTKNIQATPVELPIRKGISFKEWCEAGHILNQMDKACHWWIGDWVLFGGNNYGDKYKAYINESSFTYDTVQHDKMLAEKFKLRRRRRNLSWAHHMDVIGLPEKEQDKFLDLAEKHNWTRSQFRGALKKHKQKQLSAGGERIKNSNVIYGDFREVCKKFKDESVDCIFTDPPYGKEFLELWSALSKVATRILKPSGFCICYSGVFHLPEVYDCLREHLTYYWQCIVLHKGGGQFIKPRNLNTLYKPILVFAKPPIVTVEPAIMDIIKGSGKEKKHHEMQQPELEAEEIIRKFTDKGNIILDPFAGSGTIAVAAYKTKRKYLAIEKEKVNVNIIKKRLRKVENEKRK